MGYWPPLRAWFSPRVHKWVFGVAGKYARPATAPPHMHLGVVTTEQHSAIKQRIQQHLREQGVFTALKSIVSSTLEGGDHKPGLAADADSAALKAAQRASVLARIVADQAGGLPPAAAAEDAGQQRALLHVLLLGGRAFTYLDGEEEMAGAEGDGADRGTVFVCMQFGSQRFRSRSVPYSAEPQWQDGVLLELPPPDEATAAAIGAAGVPEMATMERLRGLCRACEPIHVLVLHAVGGRERLLSSCMLEWRQVRSPRRPKARHLPACKRSPRRPDSGRCSSRPYPCMQALTMAPSFWQVLHHGRHTLALELPGVGAEATLPVGALELKLELLPRPRAEAAMTEAEVYLTIKRERDAQVEAERRFFAYARAWWQQYVELSPAHANRAVKLFALSELGTQRPVSAFVRPLRAARLLRSPRHAAHFVSLLRHRREPAAGNAVTDVWRSVHATLATRAGETEEHALLLCSLLLGFGLDAYVCLGADGRGSHVWVLTVGADGARMFWESLNGLQYAVVPGAAGHPYTELACVFNHRALYANTQPSVKLEHASLELEDPYAWKKMDAALLKSVTPLPQAPLRPCSMGEPAALEAATEAALRALVDEHRSSRGLGRTGVVWDEELSYLLTPALASYETERMTGHAAVDQALFADAIRRKVSAGHTFKGFPHHFVTSDALSIFDTWLRDEVALSILQCRASKASLGLRLQLHPMADDVVSVWVMLAVAYKPEE